MYLPILSNIPDLSNHAFKVVDDRFSERARTAGGGLIVGGSNYGQGSSREQAVMVPRYLGIKAVIAKSFARLHLANLVNWGLLPLTFVNNEDYDSISQGDELSFETAELMEGQRFIVKNQTTNREFVVRSPLCQADLDSIKAGGRLHQVKDKNRDS